jgi:cytochrome P450
MPPLHACPAQLLDPEFHASGKVYEVWGWMRQHAPIYWHPPSYLPGFWSLTRHEDVHAVYSNPQLFSSARGVLLRPLESGEDPGGGLTLALTDPPRHKQLRTVMIHWFTERYARSLQDSLRRKVREFLVGALEQGGCDFAQDIAPRVALHVTCHVLGVPHADHADVFRWTQEAFMAEKPLAAHRQFMLYMGELMEQRIKRPADDLTSALVEGGVGGELLSEHEILLNIENLIGATENAGLSMAGGVLAFLTYPGSWARLRENRELLTTAVEEVLRWTSSATHSMRTVTEPTEIRGQRLEGGDRVVVWVPSANRDESVFTAADRFDIARRPNRHLALGFGEHFCIGNALARTQMRILLSEMLDMDLHVELSGDPVSVRSIMVRGPASLPVRVSQLRSAGECRP